MRLNHEAKADLAAWTLFIDTFNESYLFSSMVWESSEQLHFYTDASELGFGAIFGKEWFFHQWTQQQSCLHITILELFPIVLAVEVWGGMLRNRCLVFHTDNSAVMAVVNKFPVVNKLTCKEPTVMRLIRRLVVQTLRFNIRFKCQHIPGVLNVIADHLSRLQVDNF